MESSILHEELKPANTQYSSDYLQALPLDIEVAPNVLKRRCAISEPTSNSDGDLNYNYTRRDAVCYGSDGHLAAYIRCLGDALIMRTELRASVKEEV